MFSTSYRLSDYCNQQEFEVPNTDDHDRIIKMYKKENWWEEVDATQNIERLKDALYIRLDGQPIEWEALDRKTLVALAKRMNAAFFHFSGNCTALSYAMVYNLETGREVFCVKNVFPLHIGFDDDTVVRFFFDGPMRNLGRGDVQNDVEINFKKIDQTLIEDYLKTSKMVYVVSITYPIFFGQRREGHQFNAVVLKDHKNNPEIAYVDAWYPSDPVSTAEDMDKKYTLSSYTLYAKRDEGDDENPFKHP